MTSKRILITGANSYIGTSFEKYLAKYNDEHQKDCYLVDTLDMKSSSWKDYDFSKYDSIFHVAGIAHADTGNLTKEQQQLYYKVNCDLAIETAEKAKPSGVKQFIYMSSIIVYGSNPEPKNNNIITVDTKPKPDNFYGDSKLQAENRLRLLSDDKFKIVILRPPMIYGEGCKGNYKNLSKIARYSPLFPKIENIRSMLYIENLCEFIRLLIENRESGLFFPQNSEYVKTSDLVKTIANIHKRKIIFTKAFNKIIKYCKKSDGKIGKLCSKAFGNLAYSKEVSDLNLNYNLIGFEESVFRTENPTNE